MLRLGSYEPLIELASGGMATVYIARQLGAAGFERIVVVKRVHRHLLVHQDFYDMFRDEARVASMVRHQNVVPVIDVVEVKDPAPELFLVMEYVESSALSTLRKAAHELGERLPVPIVARVMADALAGLHAAHTAIDIHGRALNVVHRDVSPQNIIVGVDGSTRLIDFGVAKASYRLSETKSGSMKGKFSYMSPEQASGQDVDRRTDLFAAGIVLHECLVNRRLFRGENELDTVRRIMEEPVPAPSSVQPGIPSALDAVVLKALARPREQRFQTALEMMEALEQAASPASQREVSVYLERACGARLAERRDAVRDMLAGHVAPLTLAVPKDTESQPSRSMHDPTEVSGTENRIAVEATKSREPGGIPKIAFAAAVAIAAVLGGALVVVSSRSHTPASQPQLQPQPQPPPPPPAVTESAPPAPTASVSAAAPTPLKVDVPLEGNKKAVAPKHTATASTPATSKSDLQANPYGTP